MGGLTRVLSAMPWVNRWLYGCVLCGCVSEKFPWVCCERELLCCCVVVDAMLDVDNHNNTVLCQGLFIRCSNMLCCDLICFVLHSCCM